MLPMINGKQIIDCNLEDLKVICNNSTYRENEYIDYKAMFSVDKYSKDAKQEEAIAEFCSDVCALANASGGYLFLGIAEEKGVPQCFCGIDIKDDNPDKFELRLKNYLQKIEPRIPNCKFRFIPLDNGKHIVIILVLHDAFAPYLHIENQKDYRVYKRIGNDNRTIAYTELKRMFVQSVALEKEIEKFRKERIAYFKEQGIERFMLVHIIPDTFVDSSCNKLVYVLNRQKSKALSRIFEPAGCTYALCPIVDGFFIRDTRNYYVREGRLFNNLILECYDSLEKEVEPHSNHNGTFEYFYYSDVWKLISDLFDSYISEMIHHLSTKRVFVCISIIGCKDVVSRTTEFQMYAATIEKSELLIDSCVLEDITNSKSLEQFKKYLNLNYYLSLGISEGKEFAELIKEFEQ